MIKHVEELRAELKLKLLCEIEVFEERRIDVRSTGTVEDISSSVPEYPVRGLRKCGWVKPLLEATLILAWKARLRRPFVALDDERRPAIEKR